MSVSNKGPGVDSRLQNLTNALYVDGNDDVVVRTGFAGNIVISGNVNIPGTVQVESDHDHPVHTHTDELGNIDLSNTWMPVQGNVTVTGNANVIVQGNIAGITTLPAITGNVGVSGNVDVDHLPNVTIGSMPGVTGNVHVYGNVGVDNFPSNVRVTDMPGVTGNVHVYGGNVQVTQGTTPWTVNGTVSIEATPGGAGFEFTSKNRLKVSTYQTVFFNTFQYTKETDVWDEALTNGATATFDSNLSAVVMSVTSTAGSQVIRQTFNAQRYIPGRTSTLNFAIRMQTPTAGIRRRFGLFDERDGCYFEDAGTVDLDTGLPQYYCVLRSYASGALVEDRVERASWNGDKLDGAGTSGITANPEAIHMFGVEYEWYGAGQVKFVYIINGVSHTIHTFNTANIKSEPWCTTPFLPIRLELTNVTGVAGTHYLYQGSNSLISEGVPEKLGIGVNYTSPIAGTNLATKDLWYPVLSIRLKPAGLRGIVLPVFFQVATLDNTMVFYKLVRNCVLGTGGNGWTDHPDPNAFTQIQTYTTPSAIADINHGSAIDSGFITTGGGGTGVRMDKDTVYQLGRNNMGTASDTLTLLVASAITNKSAVASMTWIEQR